MANTRSATFSIRLNPQTKKRLAKLAEASGRSANFLISDAVDSYVADHERMLAEIRRWPLPLICFVGKAFRTNTALGRMGVL